MIRYRPFLNSDPPALAEIWSRQPPSRAYFQPMTPALLDHLVLSKPYFDRQGLIVAVDDDRPVGFAHGGFGPNATRSGLDHTAGIVCLLMVAPHFEAERIAQQLLDRCEDYLRNQGAQVISGGAIQEPNPFYLGLFGGSGSWGVPASDVTAVRALRLAGYQEARHWLVYQRELVGFRPLLERQLIHLRRQLPLERTPESLPADWWEACIYGQVDQTHFVVAPSAGEPAWGTATFWDVEPIASSWGVHAVGLLKMSIFRSAAEGGQELVATHLLGESLRQLHSHGVTRAEIQVESCDPLVGDVCMRLGFREVDRAVGFRKTL